MDSGERRLAGLRSGHDTERPDVETSSEHYALRFSGPGGRYLLERQRRAAERALAAVGPRPLSVLDVGGGHGQLLDLFAERGDRVTVHASTERCLARLDTTRRAGARLPALERCVSPLWDLPFDDGSFDLVTGFRLLSHVTRWRELLNEMTRVSRRYVMVEFPVTAGVQRFARRLFHLKRRLEGDTRAFFMYRPGEVRAYVERLGFTCRYEEGQFFLPIVFHRVLGRPAASGAMEGALRVAQLPAHWRSPVVLLLERTGSPVPMPAPVRARAGSESQVPR
jgi:SAM-dependent methyltransferase